LIPVLPANSATHCFEWSDDGTSACTSRDGQAHQWELCIQDGQQMGLQGGPPPYTPNDANVTFDDCECDGDMLVCNGTCPLCQQTRKWRFVVGVNCNVQNGVCIEYHYISACVQDKDNPPPGENPDHTHD
jgi:hypothetical protein